MCVREQGVALLGISASPPITSLRRGFVYFPKSTEAPRVEPEREGVAGLTGRGIDASWFTQTALSFWKRG